MIAWCARCKGPQECDERGCTVCWTLRLRDSPVHAAYARRRRQRLASEGVCINGRSHGAPMPGQTKCQRCVSVHRASNRSAP